MPTCRLCHVSVRFLCRSKTMYVCSVSSLGLALVLCSLFRTFNNDSNVTSTDRCMSNASVTVPITIDGSCLRSAADLNELNTYSRRQPSSYDHFAGVQRVVRPKCRLYIEISLSLSFIVMIRVQCASAVIVKRRRDIRLGSAQRTIETMPAERDEATCRR
jgi:hypothetical protein